MSGQQACAAWGSLLAVIAAVLLGSGLFGNEPQGPPPEKLLPAGALLYIGWDGIDAHRDAWQKTAAHDALSESGLGDVFVRLVRWAEREAGPGGPHVRMAASALEHMGRHGVYLAAAVPSAAQGPPLPQVTVVVPQAGRAAAELTALAQQAAPGEVHQQTVDGRQVSRIRIPNLPAVEIGWWAEGAHLVLAAGVGATDAALAVAGGRSPDITANALWKQHRSPAGFETALVQWIDLPALREMAAGVPISTGPGRPPARVADVLAALGLSNVGAQSYRWGFKDRALWSELSVATTGPRTGILSFADQKPLTLAELPGLPGGTDGFYAGRMDWSRAAEGIERMSAALLRQLGPPDAPSAEQLLAQVQQETGVNLRTDLLEPLGDVLVLYGDTRQGLFGMGIGLAISVDDAQTLRSTFARLMTRLSAAAGGDVRVQSRERAGRTVHFLEFPQAPIVSPALTVDEGWLIVGLYPQTVESFVLRQQGKLPRWELPVDTRAALAELPAHHTSLTFADPREGLRTALGLAPMGLSFLQMGLMEQRRRQLGGQPATPVEPPLTLADFPPAEAVTGPLFPNLSVCTVEPDRIRWTSRSSFPAIPLLGGAGIGSGGSSAPVLVALLLPAVQQAREAARRSQSMNNLKQIALALHNFHDTNNGFPSGTHQNDRLKPDKRLSWISDILPYLDQAALHQQLDFSRAWDDEANARVGRARVPVLLNPGLAAAEGDYAPTHYVGLAGVGADAPTLPVTDRRAGAFGYNRITGIRDILDGTSNTMGVTEAARDFGPWSAGGPATIRALTRKPYINGPDGLGGPFRGGMHAMFLDGSVRFISEQIDPGVLEKLTTIAGGEVVGEF